MLALWEFVTGGCSVSGYWGWEEGSNGYWLWKCFKTWPRKHQNTSFIFSKQHWCKTLLASKNTKLKQLNTRSPAKTWGVRNRLLLWSDYPTIWLATLFQATKFLSTATAASRIMLIAPRCSSLSPVRLQVKERLNSDVFPWGRASGPNLDVATDVAGCSSTAANEWHSSHSTVEEASWLAHSVRRCWPRCWPRSCTTIRRTSAAPGSSGE